MGEGRQGGQYQTTAMKPMNGAIVFRALFVAAAFIPMQIFCPHGAHAQDSYPQKPVRMIMPVSAGSGSDVIGRIIATGMSEHFGQQVVVAEAPSPPPSLFASRTSALRRCS